MGVLKLLLPAADYLDLFRQSEPGIIGSANQQWLEQNQQENKQGSKSLGQELGNHDVKKNMIFWKKKNTLLWAVHQPGFIWVPWQVSVLLLSWAPRPKNIKHLKQYSFSDFCGEVVFSKCNRLYGALLMCQLQAHLCSIKSIK